MAFLGLHSPEWLAERQVRFEAERTAWFVAHPHGVHASFGTSDRGRGSHHRILDGAGAQVELVVWSDPDTHQVFRHLAHPETGNAYRNDAGDDVASETLDVTGLGWTLVAPDGTRTAL